MRQLLLVDDDDLSRELLALLLSEAGWSVTTAENGEEAVTLLSSAAAAGILPDCVMTDLQMPGLSGAALVTALRAIAANGQPAEKAQPARRRQLPVFAMSGSPAPSETLKSFDGFLLKPYETEAVDALLDSWLTSHAGLPAVDVPKTADLMLEEEPLDPATRAKLAAAMPAARLAALDAMCLQDAATRLERLRTALDTQDGPAFRREAHALKGSASMIGAREVGRLAGDLELDDLQNREAAKVLLADLIASCERLRSTLGLQPVEVE